MGLDWFGYQIRECGGIDSIHDAHLAKLEDTLAKSFCDFSKRSLALNCFTSTGALIQGVYFAKYEFRLSTSIEARTLPYSPPIFFSGILSGIRESERM